MSRKRMTVQEYKTAEAFVRAANLIYALERVAEPSVGLALNDAREYLNQRATQILDEAEGPNA